MPQIVCENLSLGYGGKTVIQNLNFSVNAGDYFCVIGENGSGKSTLIKTILNLLPPVSGTIKFSKELTRKQIGYLPQQMDFQRDFPASVSEIVLSGCQNKCAFRPFYSKNEKKLADNAMIKMNISSLKNYCYRELSGGQQQRVLLARALCAAEKVLILDEPVSGLDPKASFDMYEVIAELNHDGITIIMVSHDIKSAEKYANRILNLTAERTK